MELDGLQPGLAGGVQHPHGDPPAPDLVRPLLTAYATDSLGPNATPASMRLAVAAALEACLHAADTALLFDHLAPLFAATTAGTRVGVWVGVLSDE